jgi:hypothetical protein
VGSRHLNVDGRKRRPIRAIEEQTVFTASLFLGARRPNDPLVATRGTYLGIDLNGAGADFTEYHT